MAIHLTTFQQGSTLTSFFISHLLFIQILHTTADTINLPRKANCTGQSYTKNSPFATSLASLLSILIIKSASSNSATANATNSVYGVYMCQGDLSSFDCNTCVSTASGAITNSCPGFSQGIIWYDNCELRYSDFNFFGVPGTAGFSMGNPDENTTSTKPFSVVTDLVNIAPVQPLMFASEARVNDSIFALAQCTVDLSVKDCSKCLNTILADIQKCCMGYQGWRYLATSCWVRYEASPFLSNLNGTPAVSSVPVPQPTSSLPQPTGPPPQDDGGARKKSSKAKVAAIIASVLGLTLLGPILYSLWWKLRRKNARGRARFSDTSPLHDADLNQIQMDLAIIQAATSNFSDKNKLGEGGFGTVYKGIIHGGKEIAVKRLSKKSKQGSTEFKNEVKLIAKLQHRNLVRMLGYCIEGEEKLLVYEFLPNKALDAFLFDPNKRAQLDWNKRVHIIAGIARGLLYLHEDSRLKVIHRDLKASNVLLDNEMNPKISDFGLAKISGQDESEINTNRIVGTYGYMAPEYAMDGLCSVKSDVYSFGVLLLEIISGEKNGRLHYERYGQTLLRHAWKLWNEDRAMELMDSLLEGSYPTNEATKCIHIGLLCVQENSEERPTMSLVVHMLRGDESVIPPPTQPPTFTRQRTSASNSSSNTNSRISNSINEMTESIIEPR